MGPPILHTTVIIVGVWLQTALCQVTFSADGFANLTNVQFYNDTVYLAGNGKLYELTADLVQKQKIDTCYRNSCNNVNKILLVNQRMQEILMCGTDTTNGTCQIRSLRNLQSITRTNKGLQSESEKAITITSIPDRPAVGLVTSSGYFYIGTTWGPDIVPIADKFYTYYSFLSSRKLSDFEFEGGVSLPKKVKLKLPKDVTLDKYLVFFRAVFEDNWFTYFLTNQKMKVGDEHNVSKIIRLCQNDTKFHSYIDVEIQCINSEGTRYNLVQDASLFEPGLELKTSMKLEEGDKVLALAFTNATNPESPSPHYSSAICLYSLKQINNVLLDAKQDSVICPGSNLTDTERYLEDGVMHCTEELVVWDFEAVCPIEGSSLYNFYYAIGMPHVPVWSKSIYNTTADDITQILGSTVTGTVYTHLYLGTSNGQLLMLNVDTGHLYSTLDVDLGHPILAIQQLGEVYYAMSDRKLVRYEKTNCSEYSTCPDTMNGSNPLCGWCVYNNRSTRNNMCPDVSSRNHWLPASGGCVTIHLQPRGGPVNTETNVTVNTTNLPAAISGDSYYCQFVTGDTTTTRSASNSAATFTCTTPNIAGHTVAKLQLYVKHGEDDILLAESSFLFFDCNQYTSCLLCVDDEGAQCKWCSQSLQCQPTTTICDSPLNSTMGGACPRLADNTGQHYLPNAVLTMVNLTVINIDTTMTYKCHIDGTSTNASVLSNSLLQCPVQVHYDDNVSEKNFSIFVTYNMTQIRIDDAYQNTVTVYRCEYGSVSVLLDCSQCGALNMSRYQCHWCDSLRCGFSPDCNVASRCPAPSIYKVLPSSTPLEGNTCVTIYGGELGSFRANITNIALGGVSCNMTTCGNAPHFVPSKRVVCTTGLSNVMKVNTTVEITVNGQSANEGNLSYLFSYLDPELTAITPTSGPVAGGTWITITGRHLGVGNRRVFVQFEKKSESKLLNCSNSRVEPNVPFDAQVSKPFEILCETAPVGEVDFQTNTVSVVFDDNTTRSLKSNYTYTANPTITDVIPKKAISMGGTRITVTGEQMNNAQAAHIAVTVNGVEAHQVPCIERTANQIICKTPALTKSLKKKLSDLSATRRRRDTGCSGCIDVTVLVKLDGVHKSFTIKYFSDPQFHMLEEGNGVRLYSTEDQYLTIMGNKLNLVATMLDINVTIGLATCSVVKLTSTSLTCEAPEQQPISLLYGSDKAEVNVTVGNMYTTVGYLHYRDPVTDNKLIIIAIVCGCLAALAIVGVVFGLIKYRRMGKKAREFQETLIELETEIKNVVREEFADMHTSMSIVSTNLVEQGFPYLGYQHYAFKVMFPADFMDNHPLLHEPAVSDGVRAKMKSGLSLFESLVYNKFFLISVISSMEKQKKFFLKDKSTMAGNISALLLGRMDYLQEILCVLLTSLVQDAEKKAQKTLFRRCESITEKLLHNWLSLCLYPHIKSHSGSPLYLLYKATQIIMESGPIDAVTHDAKYTFCEEKLLKKYSQQARDGSNDPTFEAKSLTLNVVVDNCQDIQVCKVLDCDTVTQVKQKCLSQIYINYPASNLVVGPAELQLEWHAGFSGSLNLRDEDNTSKRDGEWLRINTLAHYNVQDGSNMALVDPQSNELNQQQDYANLAQIQLDHNTTCNRSFDSSEPLTAQAMRSDDENPLELKKWHIVRPEGESQKQKSAIAELYLNRLLTTKQSILDYVRALFDIVLSAESVPPPVKFLYDFLDDVADTAKVEPETLHLWKSHSYPIRVWASLIRKPASLFDINSPSYVDMSMDIISQVFIESFHIAEQKLTKYSPTYKLIFNNEMNLYRERVQQFYQGVRDSQQQPESLRQYLQDLNKVQIQDTRFNKTSALYKFYQELQPYMSDILEDLADNKETSSLQLDKKLEQVLATMEEEL